MLIVTSIINILDKILDIIFMPVSVLMHGIDGIMSATWSAISGLAYVIAVIILLISGIVILPKELVAFSIPNVVFAVILIAMCISILT